MEIGKKKEKTHQYVRLFPLWKSMQRKNHDVPLRGKISGEENKKALKTKKIGRKFYVEYEYEMF